MRFKSLRIQREVHGRKVDARVVMALRYMDSMITELTRHVDPPTPEVTITSVIRTRQEQMALNNKRGNDLRWVSLHEKGGAADVRIWHWPDGLTRKMADLVMSAFPEIEVIVEDDHLHVELREVERVDWDLKVDIVRTARMRAEPREPAPLLATTEPTEGETAT